MPSKFRKKIDVTQDYLKTILHYDELTGVFTWRVNRIGRYGRVGAIAGRCVGGYIDIQVGGRSIGSHRLAWLYVYGTLPIGSLDHINGIRSDNRICNLREANKSTNSQNTKLNSRNKTGAKGVRFETGKSHYVSYIHLNGKAYRLGSFHILDEAAHAYNKAAIEKFGEFAVLNPIGKDKT